jgi:class 3 adenylate cyclase
MGELHSKRFDEPDEVVSAPNLTGQIVVLGDIYVGRYIHRPGFRWSTDIKPLVGTSSCQVHHQGVVLSGYMHMITDEGGQHTFGPGEAFDMPPGHDGWVVGDEPCVTIEFRGVRDWAKPTLAGQRVLATLLFTDIVGSTDNAARMGDAAWKELLARHYNRVRLELDRFRGFESTTTGDGFLALFDSAERAVHCAAAICQAAREDGIEVRVGVHAGEVQRYLNSVQGVAVHMAARIMALAGPGEVLLSVSTVALLEGSGLTFADAGEHELKGFQGQRRLYRLVGDYAASADSAA